MPSINGAVQAEVASSGAATYVGEIVHKGKIHQGQHQAIVERALFDQAQILLASLSSEGMRGPRLVSGSLLQGLVLDCYGRTMGSEHTTRSGQRFRYYVKHPRTITADGPAPYRLAASDLQRHCTSLLADHMAGQVTSVDGYGEAQRVAAILRDGPHGDRRDLLVRHVRKVTIGDGQLTIHTTDGMTLERSIERVRHGNDASLVVGEPANPKRKHPRPDPQLIILLQDAYWARALALAKPRLSIDQLATLFGRSNERYRRLLRLSYLSPAIATVIVEARRPAHLSNRFLQHLNGLPTLWSHQKQLLLA